MSNAHFDPIVHANVRRRHHKRAPVRLPARDVFDDNDNDNIDPQGQHGGSGGGLIEGLTTVVDSLVHPGMTIPHTEVPPFVDTFTPGVPAPATPPAGQPTPAQPPTALSSSSSSSSSTPSSTSSTIASSSSSTTSPSTTPTSTNSLPLVSPGPKSVVSTVSPSTPTPSALDNTVGAVDTHKGLSGGAIGGIVAVIIIAVIAVAVFAVRKTFLRRRQNKRSTWSAGVFPAPDSGVDVFEKASPPPLPEKSFVPTSLSPPPMSYNNPLSPPPATLQPAMGAPAVALSPASSNVAIVRCTFIPTLPDELSISTGEIVRVLNEYDDGWALCANDRNEQGVVPLECLDRASAGGKNGAGTYIGQGTGDWRMSRRASSLIGAPGPGTRY